MPRIPISGATYVDAIDDAYCALFIGSHIQTHLGRVEFPQGEPWGIHNLVCTDIETESGQRVAGFKFVGLAHTAVNRLWEWSSRKQWQAIDGPTSGRVVYDATGQIRDIDPAGYQYFDERTGQPVRRLETYSPNHGLSEWATIGDDFLIGQGHDSIAPPGAGGVLLWDLKQNVYRQLDTGSCTFIRRHVRERITIAYIKAGEGAVRYPTTLEELRALPIYTPISAPPAPPKPPENPQMALIAPNEMAAVQRVMREHPEINTKDEATRGRVLDYACADANTREPRKAWGRKARNADGTNLNTDVMAFLRPDNDVEYYDSIDGNSGAASWGPSGPFKPGQNGYWVSAQPGSDVMVPTPNVHLYDGGEHDTDVCDICHLSRFDPVHVNPESTVKHNYNGGEQDTGLCDICQKPPEDPIHQLSPQQPPGGAGVTGGTVSLDSAALGLLDEILASCHAQETRLGETVGALQELRSAVISAGQNLTGEIVKAVPGILSVLLPFLKKTPKPTAKRKRR